MFVGGGGKNLFLGEVGGLQKLPPPLHHVTWMKKWTCPPGGLFDRLCHLLLASTSVGISTNLTLSPPGITQIALYIYCIYTFICSYGSVPSLPRDHRRRIQTEEKAKVVAGVWATE